MTTRAARLASVVLVTAVTLTACSAEAPTPTPSVSSGSLTEGETVTAPASHVPTEAPSTAPARRPSPTPVPTRAPSQEEVENAAYEELARSRGKEWIGGVGSGINLGRSFCENLRQNYADDPPRAVSSLIENAVSRDPSAIEVFCPEFTEALRTAETGFGDGTHVVGQDIAAGSYTTVVFPGSSGTSDCYWERTTPSGQTIANDFVRLAPQGVTVTVGAGEGFVSQGCTAWLPAP